MRTLLVGKVIKVSDGDTFTIKTESGKHKVRLAQIDAPERAYFGKPAQPFSFEAFSFLYSLVFNRVVSVDVESVDGYQRKVGTVCLENGTNVNREMVKSGLAWVYHEYVTDLVLIDFENDAKAKRIGIWSISEQINPHDFRVGK